MRETGPESDPTDLADRTPFGVAHIHRLTSRDIAPALEDAHQEQRRASDRQSVMRWEPVSQGELISYHRQLFLWRLLLERPWILLNTAAGLEEARGYDRAET